MSLADILVYEQMNTLHNHMAGLLFLFLMQAMDESFKKQCALPEQEF
jgi:hypothetical protein